MNKFIESEAVTEGDVICNSCDEIIYSCCCCDDYFSVGDTIFCCEERHYCPDCLDKQKK